MPTVRTTPVIRGLLIVSVVAFLFQVFADTFVGTHIFEILSLVPYKVLHQGALWQPVTYMFMHTDLFHILFNMLVLWMIGSELESQWGPKFFTKYYFFCGLTGGIVYLVVQFLLFRGTTTLLMPVAGSSGAIYGLLVAYGIIYSDRIMLFMMVFPMKAKHFVLILAAIEFVSSVLGARGGLANLAHLGGMFAGFAYLIISASLRLRAKNHKGGKGRKRKSHLRLIINNEVLSDFDTDSDSNDDSDNSQPPVVH